MEKRMSTVLLKKLFQPCRSRIVATVTAVVSIMVLLATQNMGTAAAGTETGKNDYLLDCQDGTNRACLWINANDDPDPAKRADKRALIIKEGSVPDLDDPTPYNRGKVHGMTAEFTDNISNGWNLLTYDLCLMDTADYKDKDNKYGIESGVPLRYSKFVFVAKIGKSFSQLGDWNDTFDYYTTARDGDCPRGGFIFRSDTQEIIDRW
jgi:hypothetical protein